MTSAIQYEDLVSYSIVRMHLAQVVEAAPPGFTYHGEAAMRGSCLYWRNGDADCIVAKLLRSMGISDEILSVLDDCATQTSIADLHRVRPEITALFTRPVALALAHVQSRQDSGTPWSLLPAQMESWWQGYGTPREGI